MKPRERHMLLIQISAFDQPCSMRLQLPCKLLDHSAYYKYQQTSMLYDKKQQEMRDYFIITEDGTHRPPNDVVISPLPLNFYKTISLDIEIMIPSGTDDEMDDNKQFMQFPQYLLNLDYSKIAAVLKPKERDQPIKSSESLKNRAETAPPDDACTKEEQQKYSNIELLKDTIDCIVLTVLESDVLWRALREQKDNPPPYYVQFKEDDSLRRDVVKERQQLVQQSLKTMQPPMMSTIFEQIITDSIHELFQLGCQTKDTLDLHYIYNTEMLKCKNCSYMTCTRQMS
ncbi:hypothetical protein AMK59_7468 [Oryctes borbonicus]|uniref:Uncharacterized protein n=1 Tax=Oryctes borbonicus TaxID=1629725 RepID=A0A0T6AWR8_9SCAR|nr:hypothetical protein AMK59_7468 [Oryctes borbonicus]